MGGKIIAAAAITAAMMSAGPASADEPAAGNDCARNELNRTVTSSGGATIRCLVNEKGHRTWVVDTEQTDTQYTPPGQTDTQYTAPGQTDSQRAPPAGADVPVVDADCPRSRLNQQAISSIGGTVQCKADELGGFTWSLETKAAETKKMLESEGYTVTINHNGGGPLEECSVTSIGTPITRIEPERERTGNNRKTNIVSKKTIAVTVYCPESKPKPKQ